jgi:hypothetical protein
MQKNPAIDAMLELGKSLKIVVDPVYDAISSLGTGIVSAYKSCEEIVRKTFNPNTADSAQKITKLSPEQRRQENLKEAAQKIADLYENNCTSKELTVPYEGKKLIYDNALHLYEKIGEGSDDQKERKLITLLHRHRVASRKIR